MRVPPSSFRTPISDFRLREARPRGALWEARRPGRLHFQMVRNTEYSYEYCFLRQGAEEKRLVPIPHSLLHQSSRPALQPSIMLRVLAFWLGRGSLNCSDARRFGMSQDGAPRRNSYEVWRR